MAGPPERGPSDPAGRVESGDDEGPLGPVYIDGEEVGRIEAEEGELVYVTERGPDGWVQKYDGFGISEDLLQNQGHGLNLVHEVEAVRVLFDGHQHDGQVFEARPDHWKRNATQDQLGNYESQLFLAADDFELVR